MNKDLQNYIKPSFLLKLNKEEKEKYCSYISKILILFKDLIQAINKQNKDLHADESFHQAIKKLFEIERYINVNQVKYYIVEKILDYDIEQVYDEIETIEYVDNIFEKVKENI